MEPYDVRAGVSLDRPDPVHVLPKSLPIPANNHKTITTMTPDANSKRRKSPCPRSLRRLPDACRSPAETTYQEPPKAASVLASIARQSSSRSACSTSAMARTVSGTR